MNFTAFDLALSRSRLFSVIVGVFFCFQADRDVLALAMQEQLDSYLAMKACKYCGSIVVVFFTFH